MSEDQVVLELAATSAGDAACLDAADAVVAAAVHVTPHGAALMGAVLTDAYVGQYGGSAVLAELGDAAPSVADLAAAGLAAAAPAVGGSSCELQ